MDRIVVWVGIVVSVDQWLVVGMEVVDLVLVLLLVSLQVVVWNCLLVQVCVLVVWVLWMFVVLLWLAVVVCCLLVLWATVLL